MPADSVSDPPEGAGILTSLRSLLDPLAKRLNDVLRPNPPLDSSDVLCLADMCPFDSQAEGEDWVAWSRWCGIFDREEWDIIGHVRDAKRYYEVGQGSVRRFGSAFTI